MYTITKLIQLKCLHCCPKCLLKKNSPAYSAQSMASHYAVINMTSNIIIEMLRTKKGQIVATNGDTSAYLDDGRFEAKGTIISETVRSSKCKFSTTK